MFKKVVSNPNSTRITRRIGIRRVIRVELGFDVTFREKMKYTLFNSCIRGTGAGAEIRLFAKSIVAMDLRAEAKVHKYEAELNDNLSIEYTNFDLGGGLYTQIRPFGKKSNKLKGIVIEPSLRYWANVSSTLDSNFEYLTNDDQIVVHEPYPLNFFMNISVGYTFGL